MTSVVTSKGQITIPRDLREKFGIAPGTKIAFAVGPDGIRLRKAIDPEKARSVIGILKGKFKGRTLTEVMDDLRGPVEPFIKEKLKKKR